MIAKKVIVRGRVQGVGFRYFTKQLADKLGVTGVVWNASDGSVRIEAQADETVMTDFVNGVKVSPSSYGRVDSVESEIIPVDESRHVFKAI
ncbi:acylphosphatase [Weissella cibaria]|uniref:acylphosphatase n=1 Tax=Weissella cibaria TaxID=137591 RepID=UPI0022E553DA|nr:acylphosphatase [Weissella cibaria]